MTMDGWVPLRLYFVPQEYYPTLLLALHYYRQGALSMSLPILVRNVCRTWVEQPAGLRRGKEGMEGMEMNN